MRLARFALLGAALTAVTGCSDSTEGPTTPNIPALAFVRYINAIPDTLNTTVRFIDEATLAREHAGMPHGGFVIRSGQTASAERQTMEFSLKLDSNPAFTSSVLVAYARAAWRMKAAGETGARTVFDVAPGLLSHRSPEALRQALL